MTMNFESHSHPQYATSVQFQPGPEYDRFELLSAYLDGEVTASERRQVEEWLSTDPEVRRLYNRLLKLQSTCQDAPIPQAQQTTDQVVEQVFARIDRHPSRVLVGIGVALATICVGTIGVLFVEQRPFSPQLAESPVPELKTDALLIALDKPVIEIPQVKGAKTKSLAPVHSQNPAQ